MSEGSGADSRKIGVFGTRGTIDGVNLKSTADVMKAVGNNTGNLVFQYACHKIIGEETLVIGTETSWDVRAIQERCRAIIVPSANFVRENFDMSGFVEYIERINLPVLFLGIGAQADAVGQRSFDLHPSIERLLALIRERSPKVAVRGDFTAQVLDGYGIPGIEVTGCPSNFLNPDPDLARHIHAKLQAPLSSFMTHGDEPWPRNRRKQEVERRLVSWTARGPSVQCQQSVPAFMEYIRVNNPFAGSDMPGNREEALRVALMPEAPLAEFRSFMAARLRVYFSVPQWLEDSARFDFSIGLRLHGNMVAWQAGTPALWIYHDSRTHELAETMALPAIPFEEFLEHCPTPEAARSRIEFDPAAYTGRRAELASRMQRVVSAAGIRSSALLDAMSGQRAQ